MNRLNASNSLILTVQEAQGRAPYGKPAISSEQSRLVLLVHELSILNHALFLAKKNCFQMALTVPKLVPERSLSRPLKSEYAITLQSKVIVTAFIVALIQKLQWKVSCLQAALSLGQSTKKITARVGQPLTTGCQPHKRDATSHLQHAACSLPALVVHA